VAVTALALVLAGCGGGDTAAVSVPGECGSPHVVVTTTILGDIAGNVVGDRGRVEVLMPVGADPHSFQPSASEAAALREADVVVVNGLGLEEGLQDLVEAAEADGVPVVEGASFVEVLRFAWEEEDGGQQGEAVGEEGRSHGTLDPHIWTDPARMADVVAGLGEALAVTDPACADRWRAAAEGYRQELLRLDEEIEAILSSIPNEQRKLVTNHNALGYFADRYGFEVLGAIIPGGATFAAPSPADLAALVETLEREGVRAIFAETTQPADLAEALAAEVGDQVVVVTLYTGSLGPGGSGAETYIGMQLLNAERIAAALSS
jgi:zinc/manganese transport system substrate-binding protein